MTKRKLLNQNVLFFLISLLGLFIFSCKNPLAQSQENQLSKETVKLKISTNLARTVLPTQFNAATSGLTWKLTGTKDGIFTDLGTWSDKDNTTAYSKMTSAEISVDVGTWNFTLDVTNSSDEKVLTGTTGSIDVSTSSTLTFVMQEPTEGVVAPGQIKFTLTFPAETVANVVATLTEYGKTNEQVNPQPFTPQPGETEDSVTYTNTVSAGTYMLKLDLQQKDPADTVQYKTINTYTCLIRVAPGLCSTGTETLTSLAKLYKITYELDEGTIPGNVTTTSYNQYTKFALPKPTKDGYIFLGWCTHENCPTTNCVNLKKDGSDFLITEDTTLYAKWQKQTPEPSDPTNGLSYFSKTEGNIDCLEIYSAEGLKAYRDYINKTTTTLQVAYRDNNGQNNTKTFSGNSGRIDAYLMTDITVENWIPIGKNGTSTYFEFEGNNYTITIKSIDSSSEYVGVFGYVGNTTATNLKIKNLTVAGEISTGKQYAGGIVAYSNGVTIENCVNKLQITGEGANTIVGGIVGYSQKETVINNCVNFANLTSAFVVGGIVGTASFIDYTNYTLTLSKCINLGQITGSAAYSYISGMVAKSNVSANISNCINIGQISGPSTSGATATSTGFIYLIKEDSVLPKLQISNCINTNSAPTGYVTNSIFVGNSNGTIGSNSNLYYDSTKWSSSDNQNDPVVKIPKTTAELCNLNSDDLSDEWSFAADGGPSRYPLPKLSEVNETVWSAITSAEEVVIETPPSGNVITSVTTESLSAGGEFVVSQEIIEVSSTIEISNSVSITGSSSIVTIKRAESFSNGPVFKISSDGSLTLSNIIIDGGAIFDLTEDIVKGDTVTDSLSGICADDGPLIVNNGGTVNLNDGSVLKNSWSSYLSNYEGGAAVFMDSGELIIDGGQIIKNYSNTAGGAIYVTGGNINIIDGKISNNYSTQRGGGIYVYPVDANVIINMTGGEISGNAAATFGGGLTVYASGSAKSVELNLISGKMNNNYAKTYGGGAYLYMGNPQSKCIVGGDTTGTFEVYQNEVGLFSNTSTAGGAGLYIHSSKNGSSGDYLFEIKENTKIYDNTVYGNPTNVLGLGVYINSGMIKMSGGSIYNNKAESVTSTIKGGGIYINGIDSFYMSGGSIKNNCQNQSSVEGKQIYNNTTTSIIINDVEETENIEDNIEI